MVKSKQTYKFIVDCNGKHCKEIRDHMKTLNFKVTTEKTWTGDHYGIKKFDTKEDAENMATKLFDKYSKDKKLYRITIESTGR